jgi:pimeloyl-ACP methyl ester carboxylesterase
MHRPLRAGFLAAGLLAAAPAQAQPDPNTDFAAYRTLFSVAALGEARGPSTVIGFTLHYRGAMTNAGFVVAGNGRSITWRFTGGEDGPVAVRNRLQSTCESTEATTTPDQATCRVVAFDGNVMSLAMPAFRPVETQIGPFRAAPLMFRHGPRVAEGVVVWSHGFGGASVDHRRRAVPGTLAMLNDAGFDILRFDRDPAEDHLAAALTTLSRALPLLRQAGYRRIVLAGQSRGAWQSVLAAAERPELVHAVLAFTPAAHGEVRQANNHGAAIEDFRRLLAGLPPGGPRLAVVVFDRDPFDPDPAARAALVAEAALSRHAPTLALHPEPPLEGHGAGNDWRFTRGHAPCLLTLVTAPDAGVARGLRRAPCGGG